MKNIIFIFAIILTVSCNNRILQNKGVSNVSYYNDTLVSESIGKHEQNKEEQIQIKKEIQDIERFVYEQENKVLLNNQVGKTFFIQAPDSIKKEVCLNTKLLI